MQTVTIKSNGSAHSTHIEIDGVAIQGVKALSVKCAVPETEAGDGLVHVTLDMVARLNVEIDDPVIESTP